METQQQHGRSHKIGFEPGCLRVSWSTRAECVSRARRLRRPCFSTVPCAPSHPLRCTMKRSVDFELVGPNADPSPACGPHGRCRFQQVRTARISTISGDNGRLTMVKERLKSLVGRVYFLNAENLLAAFIYYPLKTLTSTSEVSLPVKLLWITVDPFPPHTSECPLSMEQQNRGGSGRWW